jgi:hypothetical protein
LLFRSLETFFLLRPEYFRSEGDDKLEKVKYQLLYQ